MLIVNGRHIIIKCGDITKECSDAIVNPANSALQHGGGAARAIAVAGGEMITRQSREIIRKIGRVPTGKAVMTFGGNLPCKFVIHTVGPIWGSGHEPEKLRQSAWSWFTLAELYSLHSLSMPAISSGIYGFPKPDCARVLLAAAVEFFGQAELSLKEIVMCNFDAETCQLFREAEAVLCRKYPEYGQQS